MLRTNYSSNARLANQVIQSIGCSILGEKLNLKVEKYSTYHQIDKLKIQFWKEGRTLDGISDSYSDNDLNDIFNFSFENNKPLFFMGNFQVGWFLKSYQQKIRDMFKLEEIKPLADSQYLVFVRLGDVAHLTPPFEYYQEAIELTINRNQSNANLDSEFANKTNFITTDSPRHPLIKRIIKNYNLKLIDSSPVETILFARNFNNLILTGGTFNWLAAFLSNASNIIYPESPYQWHGDIYSSFDWECLSWKKHARFKYYVLKNFFKSYDFLVLLKRRIKSKMYKILKPIIYLIRQNSIF